MKPAIRVENLGKSYRLAHAAAPRGQYKTLRESLTGLATAPLRRLRHGGAGASTEEFWALKDLSFEVQPGEVVGIIGRNGAGKSTLLKILSRITKPSTGKVTLNGRVGSLLEVGTGFHPELTGRENVYLNGSILGMSRREIDRRFDEIVAFAEVEKFLDTPVKRYSSGMYVRLAFAVAAHLNPEILIIDEVLAVGDAPFQRKCLDQMTRLANSGRTVLLVSHNMQIIPRICRTAVFLASGRIADQGEAARVTQDYLQRLMTETQTGSLHDKPRLGDGRARFVRAEIVDPAGHPVSDYTTGDDLIVRLGIETERLLPEVELAIVIQTAQGARVFSSWTREVGFRAALEPGLRQFECRFENLRLRPGQSVMVHLWAASGDVMDFIENALVVDVSSDERHANFSTNPDQGAVLCDCAWRQLS